MGLEQSKGSGDCWFDNGTTQQFMRAHRTSEKVSQEVATPRGNQSSFESGQRPIAYSNTVSHSVSTPRGMITGAYIPEMLCSHAHDDAGSNKIDRAHANGHSSNVQPLASVEASAANSLPTPTVPRSPAVSGHTIPPMAETTPSERPGMNHDLSKDIEESRYGRRNCQQPLTPRNGNGKSTPRSRGMSGRITDRSMTPERRMPYVATKGGWIQTSVTVSDMSIAMWTQQKQDLFIEAVAATAQVHLSDVCVLSLKEKCGRRLLSIATEISFQVRAETSEHAQNIVRDLKSPTLDNMMLQANIRIRPDTARGLDVESSPSTPRSVNTSNPLSTPFRNGYSLTSSYQLQFRDGLPEDSNSDLENLKADPTFGTQGVVQGGSSSRPGADIDHKARFGAAVGELGVGTMLL